MQSLGSDLFDPAAPSGRPISARAERHLTIAGARSQNLTCARASGRGSGDPTTFTLPNERLEP